MEDQKPEQQPEEEPITHVRIVNIDIPMGDLVVMSLKLAIALIPLAIVLLILQAIGHAMFAG